MKFKTHATEVAWERLARHNPALFAVLAFADALAWQLFRKHVTITSIYRSHDDPLGLHGDWRAADVRIYDERRDAPGSELTMLEWEDLQRRINAAFDYGRKLSKPWEKTVVAHIRGVGTSSDETPHIHIQVPARRWRG